jgi:hypothetical protein
MDQYMKIEGSKLVAVVVVILALMAGAFLGGTSVGQRTMLARANQNLNGVQAMLAFNRIQDEGHLQSLLSQGCTEQAAAFIDYSKNADMALLAGLLLGKIDEDTRKYISDRDATLVENLKTFKSKYGASWMEKACKPS